MNDPCPHCGMLFQREEGYFLGAMYCSYVIGAVMLTISYFTAEALLPDWNSVALALVAMLPYLPFVPAVFRYSRVLWVWFDRAADPGDTAAGPYEKDRVRRLAAEKSDVPPTGSPDSPLRGQLPPAGPR